MGGDPETRLQIMAVEDAVRVTLESVTRMQATSTILNCCHPHVWSKRELATRIQDELGLGVVRFYETHAEQRKTASASAQRLCEWFGPPRISLENMIQRAIDTVRPLLA